MRARVSTMLVVVAIACGPRLAVDLGADARLTRRDVVRLSTTSRDFRRLEPQLARLLAEAGVPMAPAGIPTRRGVGVAPATTHMFFYDYQADSLPTGRLRVSRLTARLVKLETGQVVAAADFRSGSWTGGRLATILAGMLPILEAPPAASPRTPSR